MEELKYLTPEQDDIINKFIRENYLRDNFYFTGGTALSSCYLQHRYSDDLDFFTSGTFNNLAVLEIIQKWADSLNIKMDSQNIGELYIFTLNYNNSYSLRLDFNRYIYKPLFDPHIVSNLKIDNKKDIATNKLAVISERAEIKDFVDLYFLLKEFSIFDLLEWSNKKFRRDYDPLLLSSDFLKVEGFDYLPRMIKKVELEEVRTYFVDLAKKLGTESTD